MPTSSSRRPLVPTYRIEGELIAEHNFRMKRAASTWPGRPICPDHYRPDCKCTGEK